MIIIRSIAAIVVGFVTVVVLSEGTDYVMRSQGIFPPFEQIPSDSLLAIALAYRTVATILGGWVTAALAPNAPMRHAIILGLIGTAAGLAGTIVMWGTGPAWYPIALTVLGLPSTWLGGRLYTARTPRFAA